MPDSGIDLGADLRDLDTVATQCLPDVAKVYRQAAADLAQTADDQVPLFARSNALGGPYGPVWSVWTDLRDLMDRFFHETATNLDDTAHALSIAVAAYRASDHAADAEFQRLKRLA